MLIYRSGRFHALNLEVISELVEGSLSDDEKMSGHCRCDTSSSMAYGKTASDRLTGSCREKQLTFCVYSL